jgi:hypothetical protein
MPTLWYAHSCCRYLVLIAAVVLGVTSLVGLLSGKPAGRLSRVLGACFVGFFDLQMVSGLSLLILGFFTPRLIGHLIPMMLAVAVAHATHRVARRRPPQAHRWRLIGVLVSFLFVVVGVKAIGRPLLRVSQRTSSAPLGGR